MHSYALRGRKGKKTSSCYNASGLFHSIISLLYLLSDYGEWASLHFWPAPPEGGQNYLSVSSWDCKLGWASLRDDPCILYSYPQGDRCT